MAAVQHDRDVFWLGVLADGVSGSALPIPALSVSLEACADAFFPVHLLLFGSGFLVAFRNPVDRQLPRPRRIEANY